MTFPAGTQAGAFGNDAQYLPGTYPLAGLAHALGSDGPASLVDFDILCLVCFNANMLFGICLRCWARTVTSWL